MPSFVTHSLFAGEACEKAFGSTCPFPERYRPWLILGAQGPDPLFSGIKRQPSGSQWAYRMHREGFGRVASSLARQAKEARELHGVHAPSMTAYALGFATHAILDRKTHPFVNYFSGWVEPNSPDSEVYRFCHPFLERIIDMIMLMDRTGGDIRDFDFNKSIPALEKQTSILPKFLATALRASYNDAATDDSLEEVVKNALEDDAEFRDLMSPRNPDGMARAIEMEGRGELPKRVLGLFYPPVIPAEDFMNEDGAGWVNPRSGGEKRRESFYDLFESALGDTAIAMKSVLDSNPYSYLGDGDLDDGSLKEEAGEFIYSSPWNLSSVIDELYASPERRNK